MASKIKGQRGAIGNGHIIAIGVMEMVKRKRVKVVLEVYVGMRLVGFTPNNLIMFH